ncbi:RNA polymerase sigma factor [uncultured Duncaniella sp.]|uniref:RNA polymerase sigma factor n=1 Tax=uncultured Duncaniella sp. TaxID=2768039 RepID=UPI0025E837CA|nr:RNA polymerase sigma factor [uncultured Duncaniella sp.]MDE5915991.1 RNA polymerase sigma factor [Duncaniella sp.]
MSKEVKLDDEKLVERLRDPSTCREAFGDLIKTYSEPLYRQIRRTVQSHEDTDDILQNTFLKAWQNIENFRGDAKLSTWLYKIAINESLSFLEKERKRRGLSLDDEESGMISLIQADTNIDGDKLALRLREAIATLPEKQRLVFNMRYYDDMKYEQMSEIMGTSVGALKASYHLAVKKIEQFFEDSD